MYGPFHGAEHSRYEFCFRVANIQLDWHRPCLQIYSTRDASNWRMEHSARKRGHRKIHHRPFRYAVDIVFGDRNHHAVAIHGLDAHDRDRRSRATRGTNQGSRMNIARGDLAREWCRDLQVRFELRDRANPFLCRVAVFLSAATFASSDCAVFSATSKSFAATTPGVFAALPIR